MQSVKVKNFMRILGGDPPFDGKFCHLIDYCDFERLSEGLEVPSEPDCEEKVTGRDLLVPACLCEFESTEKDFLGRPRGLLAKFSPGSGLSMPLSDVRGGGG